MAKGNKYIAEYWSGYRDAKKHCSIWGIESATKRANEIQESVSNIKESNYWKGFSAYVGKAQTDAKEWHEMQRPKNESN